MRLAFVMKVECEGEVIKKGGMPKMGFGSKQVHDNEYNLYIEPFCYVISEGIAVVEKDIIRRRDDRDNEGWNLS